MLYVVIYKPCATATDSYAYGEATWRRVCDPRRFEQGEEMPSASLIWLMTSQLNLQLVSAVKMLNLTARV